MDNNITVIDNFLPDSEFYNLQKIFYQDTKLQFHIHRSVAYSTEDSKKHPYWNWYGVHLFYDSMKPSSNYFNLISEVFLTEMRDRCNLIALYRIKANFYPWTETLKEHNWHTDYNFPHKGALFSINTCDGYTAFEDGTKVKSVENRMVMFDPQIKHHSTTTTNSMGRYNINFNYF